MPAISNNTVTSNKKNMNRVVFVAFLFLLFGCSSKTTHLADNVIAKAFDKTLTQRDLTPILEQAKDSPDSVKFIENYLKKWAIDEILYKEAADYYRNDEQINSQVEEYRQTLVLNKYKQALAEEKSKAPTTEEIASFYVKNKSNFTLSEPIIKGAFLSITNGSPNIKHLREAMKKLDRESIDEIERISLKHPMTYSFFLDKWVKLSDVSYMIPKNIMVNVSGFASNKMYEYKDSVLSYMFKIVDFKSQNSAIPFELAKDEIEYLLKEKNDKIMLDRYLEELFAKQQKKGNIVINIKK